MADKKENAASEAKKNKTDKPAKAKVSPAQKVGNAFKKAGKAIKEFFKNFRGECRKITWPTGKTVLNSSLVVIAVVAIVGLIIFAFDSGISAAIDALVGLASDHKAKAAAETASAIFPFIMG